jgi:hypothetical protein
MAQIERGYRVPAVDVLLRVARALKAHMRDIFSELCGMSYQCNYVWPGGTHFWEIKL